ncbi:MAG TPA: polysaccharide biosynthesis/export family protein [Puia sp.]|jgi:polysaccharide export outer membrane protein
MGYIGKWSFLFCSAFVLFFMVSCVSTKKVIYFNNIQDTTLKNVNPSVESAITKSDVLGITVSSVNPQAASIFNTPGSTSATPMNPVTSGSNVAALSFNNNTLVPPIGYLVTEDGTIQFPVLGPIKVAGLTKKQLEKKIADELVDKKLLLDPIVNVRFLNFRVTVMGEVAKPTTINVYNERISLLEALGLAGDMTIYGKRENVLLIREEGNDKIVRRLNLNSEKILTSPYYYLKTNDIVYVEPNAARVASTSRTQQLLPIILSGLSFIAVIVSYSLFKHN